MTTSSSIDFRFDERQNLAMRIEPNDQGVHVEAGGRSADLSWAWLFDHADDPASVDPSTRQRIRMTFGVDAPPLRGVRVTAGRVECFWADGLETTVSRNALAAALDAHRIPEVDGVPAGLGLGDDVSLWSTPDEIELGEFHLDELRADPDRAADVVDALWRWGVVTFDGVAPGEDGTREVASLIGPVRRTFFGDVWELAADVTDHADSAYGTEELGQHTDGTYLHDAPGLQLFVCQERAGTGGESTLIDAFALAAGLAAEHPEAAALLAAVPVPGHYVEPGVDVSTARPPLRLDHRGRLVQVSYNNYDRSPFHLGELDASFRRAYAELARAADDPARRLHLEWRPGRAMLIDNWRVMHGRTGFTGSRRFLGAYLDHSDLESRHRVLCRS